MAKTTVVKRKSSSVTVHCGSVPTHLKTCSAGRIIQTPAQESTVSVRSIRKAVKTVAALRAVHPRIGGPRRVQLRKEEEGGYAVRCPSLLGCHSQGETSAEALVNISEAINLHLEVMKENNLEIPHDSSFSGA